MSDIMTYYSVCFHMKPVAYFKSVDLAESFCNDEKKRRLWALAGQKSKMTAGEYRGVKRSIEYGLTVNKVAIEFSDDDRL